MWQFFLTQFWSIIAALLELAGIWIVGKKKRIGFLVIMTGNFVWMYVSFAQHVYGILLVTVTANVIHTINYFRWRKNDFANDLINGKVI
jgi:nicotinamide riboside transporter PnuC